MKNPGTAVNFVFSFPVSSVKTACCWAHGGGMVFEPLISPI